MQFVFKACTTLYNLCTRRYFPWRIKFKLFRCSSTSTRNVRTVFQFSSFKCGNIRPTSFLSKNISISC